MEESREEIKVSDSIDPNLATYYEEELNKII